MNERRSFPKRCLILTAVGAACLIGLPFFGPSITHPPITGDIAAPPDVEAVLRKSCYDCHSNETKLSWFDHIAPATWIVNRDVQAGRAAMNFSNWDRLNEAQRSGKLFEALNQMSFGAMPLPDYVKLHPEAKLSEQDIATLRNYLITLTPELSDNATKSVPAAPPPPPSAPVREAPGVHASREVAPSPNGIAFDPNYKNWEMISSSDRVDLGQTRVILGNDVAMKAIADKRTNPWPDGTILAKLAWDQVKDADGTVRTHEFKTVGFMVKDTAKYASTSGWGFARWHGEKLVPYGQDASFATECANCHKPMEKFDFVFTAPIDFAKPPIEFLERPQP